MFKRVVKSEFLRNFFTLVTGTTIAQALPILLSPVFSRIFTPDDFGMFALFISIASAFAVVAGGRYEGAVMLPRSDREAANLVDLALRITVFISIGLALLLVVSEVFIWDHFTIAPDMRTWLLILPLFVFLYGITQTLTNWFVRRKQFRKVATARVIQSIGTNGGMVALGFMGLAGWGIFWSNLIGLTLLAVFLLAGFAGPYRKLQVHVTPNRRKKFAAKYRDFPLANGWQALIDMFQMNGIIYLIFAFFSSAVTGLYSFAYRILMAPMNFVGASIAQVFYQKASEAWFQGQDIRPLIRKTMTFSALLIAPVLLALVLAGPQIFAFVFGEEWRVAGEYSRILAPWFCLDFVRAPISQVPMIAGKIRKMLSFTFTGNLILVLVMIAGGLLLKDIRITFMILSGSMCLYTVLLLLWLYRIGRR